VYVPPTHQQDEADEEEGAGDGAVLWPAILPLAPGEGPDEGPGLLGHPQGAFPALSEWLAQERGRSGGAQIPWSAGNAPGPALAAAPRDQNGVPPWCTPV
jgi:hypothetical protein